MSNIDRQRVTAVRAMEALGYKWDGASRWTRDPSFAERERSANLDDAIREVVRLHTIDDTFVGFAIHVPQPPSGPLESERYIDAWRTLRKHVGLSA